MVSIMPQPPDGGIPCQMPGNDPDWWFPEQGDRLTAQRARQLCAACPGRAGCLEGALARNELSGIWGGLTASARQALPREHPCRGCGASAPLDVIYCSAECRQAGRHASKRAYDRSRSWRAA